MEETKIAVLAIIVKNYESVETVNALLHEYRERIVGRMGIPYRERGLSVLSVVLDAPQSEISRLSGKMGMLDGVSAKVVSAK